MERDKIKQIQDDIKACKGTRFWNEHTHSIEILSGDIWSESTRYILELLQNAEDAKAEEFRIYVSPEGVKLIHDGNPFSSQDVDSLCSVDSKKDPSRNIGYLGIGFKSVFMITDKPEIYSGGYRFRFDREQCIKELGEPSPWQIYPYWIEQPTENIDPNKTIFVLPFGEEEVYKRTLERLKELGPYSLLFFRHIKRIIIQNEETKEERVYNHAIIKKFKQAPENSNVKVGISQITEGKIATRFLVFRGRYEVSEDVRKDKETVKAKRSDITQREVTISFQLDEKNHLRPMKGYVYSFLPLRERPTNYLIQADFIVQAGRVEMLWNKWNRYLMEKAGEVVQASIRYFQKNPDEPKWREQYLSVFERRPKVEEIFHEVLEDEVEKELSNPPCARN